MSSKSSIPSSSALKQALHRYVSQLEQRVASGKAKGAKDVVELDASLWTDLVARIQTRAKEGLGPHVTLKELKEVMRWKLARGKSRPTLPSLIASNDAQTVQDVTLEALQSYETDATSALSSLKTLCQLRGVGPATASLLLSLSSPATEPFMSDESWDSLEETRGRKCTHSEKDWKIWRQGWEKWNAVQGDGEWKAWEWERACWSFAQGGSEIDGKDEVESVEKATSKKRKASNATTNKQKDDDKPVKQQRRTTRSKVAKAS